MPVVTIVAANVGSRHKKSLFARSDAGCGGATRPMEKELGHGE
jgi:hypothetical protein